MNKIVLISSFTLILALSIFLFLIPSVQALEPSTITTVEPVRNNYFSFDQYPPHAPSVHFDGANYVYNTSFGVYTLYPPETNLFEYSFHDGTKMIKRSGFRLQENSSGTWLPLLNWDNVKVSYYTNDTHQLIYEITEKIKGETYICGRVFQEMTFSYNTLPKISVRLKKEDWNICGYDDFRWIWIIGTHGSYQYWINEKTGETVDIGTVSAQNLGHLPNSKISNESSVSDVMWLSIDWEDFGNATVMGGKDAYWNEKGVVVVFPDNEPYIDPWTVATGVSSTAMGTQIQYRTFWNPRGLHYGYALIGNDLWKSATGMTWVNDTRIGNAVNSLWINSTTDPTIVYFATGTPSDYLGFTRGTIDDSSSSISLGSEDFALEDQNYTMGSRVISLDKDGYIWMGYEVYGTSTTLWVNDYPGGLSQWSLTGTSPYLDAISDGSYISTSTKDAEEGVFEFGQITPILSALIWFYAKGDGNDYFEVWIFDSEAGVLDWVYIGDITPGTSYGWHKLHVIPWKDTASYNKGQFKVIKKTTGAGGTIYIDGAKVVLNSGTEFRAVRTTEPVENFADPNDPDWTEVGTIVTSVYDTLTHLYGTMYPPNQTRDMVFGVKYKNIAGEEYLKVLDYDRSGEVFSEEIEVDALDDQFGIRFNGSSDVGHVTYHHYDQVLLDETILYRSWTLGTGFGSSSVVKDNTGKYGALTINISESPNRLYCFYAYTGTGESIYYKNTTVDTINWGDEFEVDDGEVVGMFRTTFRDYNGRVGLLYRWTIDNVARFLGIPTIPDTEPPKFSGNNSNTTIAGDPWKRWITVTDNLALSYCIPSTNTTGKWENATAIALSGTSKTCTNITTLNSTAGVLVQWKTYANDSSNNWNVSDVFNMTTTSAVAPKHWMSGNDPLKCEIPFLVLDKDLQITCMPLDNSTGIPLTGQTVNCQAWDININSEVQSKSSCSEQNGGVYNWTLKASNINPDTCYWINCSTTINSEVSGYGSSLCVMPNYNETVWQYAYRNLTWYNLSGIPSEVWSYTLRNLTWWNFTYWEKINATFFYWNETLLVDINGTIYSMANITESDVWNYATRNLTWWNHTILLDVNGTLYRVSDNQTFWLPLLNETLMLNFTYLWNQFDCSNATTNEMCRRLAGWIAEAKEIKFEGEETQDIMLQIFGGLSELINNRIVLLALLISIAFMVLVIALYHNFKKAESESLI